MMVAAISAAASTDRPNPKSSAAHLHNPTRPPLLPSERDNGIAASRRPKSREVTSRYLSSSSNSNTSTSSSSTTTTTSSSASSIYTSRRCPSPMVSRTAPSSTVSTPMPSVLKRSQSVERRRPATPRPTTPLPDSRPGNAAEVSAAAKVLFTSTRSLSVSFQGESFSLAVSKTKAAPSPNLSSTRKGTPERRRPTPLRGDQTENSKPIDQHRWPARARQVNPLTRSVDFTGEKKKLLGSGAGIRALQQSMIYEDRRASFDSRLHLDSGNADLLKTVQLAVDADSANGSAASVVASDITASDTESVSSGSNSGVQDCGVVVQGRNGPRGISVPARFWQETNSRLRRLQEPGSPLSKTGGFKAPTKLISSKKSSVESPMGSPRTVSTSRAMSSPLRGPARPVSPSKLMVSSTSSPSRGMSSPSRMRNSMVGPVASQLGNMPSILSFAGRGKLGENRVVDAHLLRILYNRQVQWRFVNARADAALLVQRLTAEKNLYDAWGTMSELRDSVTFKRIKLQLLRQNLKLTSILRGQITYLEDWGLLDRDHSSSLSGAIEALKASTLRLPVVGGTRADIQNVKDAVGSAVDVMQAMASSICSLLSKVEEVNSLVTELANVTRREHAFLYQCKDILSALAAMQVKDCSLRTHILQLKRVPTRNLTTQA